MVLIITVSVGKGHVKVNIDKAKLTLSSNNSYIYIYTGEGTLACDLEGQCEETPIGTAIALSQADCGTTYCQNLTDCQWYTYDSSSNVCLIFDKCETIDTTRTTCVTAENECVVQCNVPGTCQVIRKDI